MKRKLLILGAGGSARDLIDLVADIPDLEVSGFVVNQAPFSQGHSFLGKPVYWIDDLADFDNSYSAICALGRASKTRIVTQVQELGIPFVTIIHPMSRIAKTASVGEGVFVGAGAQISADCIVGNHVFINRGVIIGTQVEIKEYAFLSTGVKIGCDVKIGAQTFIGFGALMLPGSSIGALSVVSAGSMVSSHFPDRVKVIGYPAEIIENNIDGF